MNFPVRKILSVALIVAAAGGWLLLAGCGNASGGSVGTHTVGSIAYSDGTVSVDRIIGKTPIGVVVAVNSNGYAPKIVGLREENQSWSIVSAKLIGATDLYNGLKNQQVAEKETDWQNNYPAFEYCADYGGANGGGNWYLLPRLTIFIQLMGKNKIPPRLTHFYSALSGPSPKSCGSCR